MGRILHNRTVTGCNAEWSLELPEFDIKYESTHVIKSRVLPEFIAEWTATPEDPLAPSLPRKEDMDDSIMYSDGPFSLESVGANVHY